MLTACTTGANSRLIYSKDEYKGYKNYKFTEWCQKCNCKNTLFNSLTFEFSHDLNFDPKQSYFEFLIIRQGIIYKGNFKDTIKVDSGCFCLDDNLTKLNTLTFVLIDNKEKIVYKWGKKHSYYLYRKDKIKVKLKNDGTYKLKFI